jgi:serine O-acetyltransferase
VEKDNLNQFFEKLFKDHKSSNQCIDKQRVYNWIDSLLCLMFPDFSNRNYESIESIKEYYYASFQELENILVCNQPDKDEEIKQFVAYFYDKLPQLKEKLDLDVKATFEGDPAAKSEKEVLFSYPGFYAIAIYRIAHVLYQGKIQLIPRIMSEYAHKTTGIDIHPGATIGNHFCIDHGTGIVIGETTLIGNRVKIYQGVTLGALSVSKEDAEIKRHPTIEDNVVIYAGATILGGKTVIGENSIIGGNVWITRSLPQNSTIYYRVSLDDNYSQKESLRITTNT